MKTLWLQVSVALRFRKLALEVTAPTRPRVPQLPGQPSPEHPHLVGSLWGRGVRQCCLSCPSTSRTQISTLPESSIGSSPSSKPGTGLPASPQAAERQIPGQEPQGLRGEGWCGTYQVPHKLPALPYPRPKPIWGEGRATLTWASPSDTPLPLLTSLRKAWKRSHCLPRV